MSIKVLAFIAMFAITNSVNAMENDSNLRTSVHCFSGGSKEKPVNFEMTTIDSNLFRWGGGYIRYQNTDDVIPIVLKSIIPDPDAPNLQPPQNIITWVEVHKGEITGEYQMILQGTPQSMVYLNLKKHKSYNFELNIEASPQQELGQTKCNWLTVK